MKLDRNGIPILKPPRPKRRLTETLPKLTTLADAEQRMCREKRPFATEGDALACNRGQRAYKCPVCDWWHLTSVKIRIETR